MKVVINRCWGGFGLSAMAVIRMREMGNPHAYEDVLFGELWEDGKENTHRYNSYYLMDIDRHDPDLVRVVEEMGEAANGECADLTIVNIPDGVNYEIDDYDGMETIHEVHRSWS